MVWLDLYSKLTESGLGVIIDNKLSWKPQISSLWEVFSSLWRSVQN